MADCDFVPIFQRVIETRRRHRRAPPQYPVRKVWRDEPRPRGR